jgi:hypothetical protein
MNHALRILTLGLLFSLGAVTASLAADRADPILGTWTLDLAKSKFPGDTAPKSATRVYSAGPAGTVMKMTGVAGDGSPIAQTATLTYDGKDCAVTGASAYDSFSLTRINGTTVKAELKKGGTVVGHTTRTLSAKGSVLTLSTALKTAKGGTTHMVAVYDKQ